MTNNEGRIDGEGRTEWLPLNELVVDPRVQQPPNLARQRAIANCLDLSFLGVLIVSAREDGTKVLLDGQTRQGALFMAGFTSELVECKVYYALSLEQEAEMFRMFNTRRAVKAFNDFMVSLTAGDPVAVGIRDTLARHGWKVAHSTSADGSFKAVTAARNVYTGRGLMREKERGPVAFERAVAVATGAWGHRANTLHAAIVEGLGLFFSRYDDLDTASLVRKLAQLPGGADGLIGKARGIREFRGGGIGRAMAEGLTSIYNTGRRAGKLEDWR